MMCKGNARGGAKEFADHLLSPENDHVEVYELRGFAAGTLTGALNECYAVSRGTRCKQFIYSLSVNPPKHALVTTEQFKDAINEAEKRLGLEGHGRGIVFHEKEGRRHAHAFWLRVDTSTMTARQMSFDRTKLKALTRDLFLQHGWPMPEGLADASKRDPKNFTLDEYQQAKRAGKDPRAIRAAFQDAWAISDSKAAFVNALAERGYVVARGDTKSYVAVDIHGEIYGIAKKTGVKTKDIRERLGNRDKLPSVAEAKARIAQDMLAALDSFKSEIHAVETKQTEELEKRHHALVERQRGERQALREKQHAHLIEANQIRQARFQKGIKGLWDRLSGEHARIRKRNEQEAHKEKLRDRQELDDLAFAHLEQRQKIDAFRLRVRQQHVTERRKLETDAERYSQMRLDPEARPAQGTSKRSRSRGPLPDFEP